MLVGTLLGDAHIRRNKYTTYMTFEQSLDKKDYLYHLFERVCNAGLNKNSPVQYNREDQRYNKINSSLYFRTIADDCLNTLSLLFLDASGNKVVPGNISELLTLEALAY